MYLCRISSYTHPDSYIYCRLFRPLDPVIFLKTSAVPCLTDQPLDDFIDLREFLPLSLRVAKTES